MAKAIRALDKNSAARIFKEYALMTLGTIIMVIGTYFFKFPNNFC